MSDEIYWFTASIFNTFGHSWTIESFFCFYRSQPKARRSTRDKNFLAMKKIKKKFGLFLPGMPVAVDQFPNREQKPTSCYFLSHFHAGLCHISSPIIHRTTNCKQIIMKDYVPHFTAKFRILAIPNNDGWTCQMDNHQFTARHSQKHVFSIDFHQSHLTLWYDSFFFHCIYYCFTVPYSHFSGAD